MSLLTSIRIPNFPDYRIDRRGRIWTRKKRNKGEKYGTWKRMKGHTNKHGYVIVQLNNGPRFGIHQLVLLAFVGPCPKGMYCRHLNGIRNDNRLSNLKWDTPTKNNRDKIKHGTITRGSKVNTAKLTRKKVIKIRRMFRSGTWNYSRLGRRFGVSHQAIRLIINRTNWRWVK